MPRPIFAATASGLLYKTAVLPSATSQASARTAFPLWQRTALFSLAYFACAAAGSLLSAPSGNYVSFWLPAGLFVAVLLLNPTREWLAFSLAVLPANLAFDFLHDDRPKLVVMGLFYLANVLQTVVGAWLVRRLVAERPTLALVEEFFGLIGFSGIFSPMLGAAVGAATLSAFGLSHQTFGQSWKTWWGSCAMAVLIFTPLILVWSAVQTARPEKLSWRKAVEAVLVFGGLIWLAWQLLVAGGGINTPKMPMLIFILWAGMRFGLRGATLSIFLLALWSSFLTTHYQIGVSDSDKISGGYVFTLQVFLAVSALVGLVPAIVLAERDRTMARLRDSEDRFRSLTEAAFEGVCISENGIILDMNDQGLKMFGYAREEIIGKPIIELVAPESRPLVAAAIGAGQELIYGHMTLRKDGTIFYTEAQARMVQVGGRLLRMTAIRDITERKLAEQALRKSEEKFSKAFRASPDGLAISEVETGRYIEVNEGYCKLFGHPRAEMLGHTSVELGIWENSSDRDRFISALKTVREVRNFEVRMRTRAGAGKIILLSADPIELDDRACLVSALHDVTDRIQAELALRKSEEKFSKAFRTSPDVMSIADLETGCYLEVNEAHEKIFGFKREEVVGRSPTELGILEDPALREKMLAELKVVGSVRNLEVFARNRQGDLLTVLLSAELIELGGRMCVLRVSHDITRRKQLEVEREQAVAREQQSRIEYTLQLIAAQEAERKRIAAELHDSIGQNLLLVKNLAQMALQAQTPAQVYEHVATINHLAARCIAETRQISRDLHPYQLDHLGLKRALEAMLENTAQASAIHFTAKFEPVDELFSADGAMNLYRIVQESVNNILKHSQASRADIRLERDIHEVQLRIEDDGDGFPANQLADNKKGMGLKNITERVRMLGGKLNVDSSPGHGTRIEVAIPFVEKNG